MPSQLCVLVREDSLPAPLAMQVFQLQVVRRDAARDVGTGEVERLLHGFEEGSRASPLELQIPAGHSGVRVPLIRKVLSRCWEVGAAQNAHAEDRV